MADEVPVTKEGLKAAFEKLIDERANEGFLARVSQPGILDWLITMVGKDMDRVEQKPKQEPTFRG